MARPSRCRKICFEPTYDSFIPEGISNGEKIILTLDEYEVIRLIDLNKLTHEQASKQMNISRTTVSEIYELARYKIANSLVHGRPLLISGGNYQLCQGEQNCLQNCPKRKIHKQQIITKKGVNTMRIAVTYDNGNIFQHFGHTSQFKVYDIENNQIVNEQIIDTQGQGHGALATFLNNAQADILICVWYAVFSRKVMRRASLLISSIKRCISSVSSALQVLTYSLNASVVMRLISFQSSRVCLRLYLMLRYRSRRYDRF